MKRHNIIRCFLIFSLAWLTTGLSAQQRNVISIPDATVQIGQAQLPIAVENTDELVAAQFDITLPTEVTAETTAMPADRAAGHEVVIRHMGATRYRVMLYSNENQNILGNKGTILNLKINIPASFQSGSEHAVTLSNASLTLATGENVLTEARNGRLIVAPLPDLTPTGLSVDRTTLTPGGQLVASWKVKNVGGIATGGGWSEQIVLLNRRGTVKKLLATTFQEDILAAGESISRQAEITLPDLLGIDGTAYLQVIIVPDNDTGESTSAQGNNSFTTESTINVEKRLFVELSPARVVEGRTGRVAVKVSRSGNWNGEQTFNLVATADPRVTLPATVTIPVGQSGAVAYLSIANNSLLDADSVVTVTATGNSYPETQAKLIIEDNEYPDITVQTSKIDLQEGDQFTLTITVGRASNDDVAMTLTSENNKRFTFPSTVTLPAGQTSVTVDVTAKEDDIPQSTLTNAFTVSAPNYNKGMVDVVLADNDIPVLEMELTPNQVQESDGPLCISAVLRRVTHTDKRVTVRLSDDSKGGIYYGNQTLELAKGVEEVHFNLGPIDNATVDGDRTYTVTAAVWLSSCSCSAAGEAAGNVSAQFRVLDDDGLALRLTSNKTTVKEGDKTQLTVTRNTTDTSSPLSVTLSSDLEAGVSYNHTVVIPTGSQTATVEITTAKNDVQNDSHAIVFTAAATGYSSATCYIMVTDQTMPDARITSLTPDKAETEVNTTVTLTATVANVGAAPLPSGVPVKLYQRGVNGAIATLYTSQALGIDESLTLSREVTLPANIGTHRFYAVINESNTIEELSFTNNTSPEAAVKTVSPFGVTVSTDKTVYQTGEKVHITGKLSGKGISNTLVELYVINEGSRQRVGVTTDAQGAFSYEWQLYDLQSGHFIVGACYPEEGLRTEMAAFDVYGLRRSTYGNITCSPLVGEPHNGIIRLSNPGVLSLSNVRVELLSKPDHITAQFSSIPTMEGGSTKDITFTLNSNVLSPDNVWEEVKIRILTNEGPTEDVTLYYHNASPRAVLSTNVNQINTTMLIGEGREYTFYITNTGKGATGNITLGLPDWMTTLTASTIPSLNYGQQAKVVLKMMPTEDMQVNVPRTGRISINCENGNGAAITYSIKPVSDKKGVLVVDVTDEYTFLTDEKPHVAGAHVEVRQPVTNELAASGEAGADGIFRVELPSGYYKVSVTADKHDAYTNNIVVDPGTETPVDVFLSFKAITYSWEVVETEVEDVYDIVTTVTYETRAPKPVVIVDFPQELPYKSQVFNIAVTNKGLISAYNVYVDLPVRQDATFEPLIPLPIDTLKPQMSLFIPIRMTVTTEEEVESLTSVDNGGSFYGEAAGDDSGSSPSLAPRRNLKDEVEEVSPGCWRITFTVAHDRMECDKKTGKQYKAGVDYYSRTYYYGKCGGDGGSGTNGGWIPNLPSWQPSTNPAKPTDPSPPTDGPTSVTHPTDNDNSQSTKVIDGCTTDCTDAAINAAIGCALAAGGCAASGGLSSLFTCVGGLVAGCHSLDLSNASSVVDCILAGLGCIPGPWGCVAGVAGCAKSIYDGYVTCVNGGSSGDGNSGGGNSGSGNSGGNNTGGGTGGDNPSSPSLSITKNNPGGISVSYNGTSKAMEKVALLLGPGDWDNVTGREFDDLNLYIQDKVAKGESLMSPDRMHHKPYALAESDFDRFISRIDITVYPDHKPIAEDIRPVDIDAIGQIDEELKEIDKQAQDMGYNSFSELNDSVGSHYDYLIEEGNKGSRSSVCATITLQIKQTMTMTRQAFRGTLSVFNGHPTGSMENVRLNLEVRDSKGQLATSHEFQINAEKLEGFAGELNLTDGWTLAGNANGTATILFIPTKYAAPEESEKYSFGGTLTYLDPFTGYEVTRTLAPVTLTVKPSPELDLTYFMQRDIFGDDPLTTEVEPMVPAEFALLINNKGYGDATNVKMVTNQPEIIENSKGLFINFEIVSSQVNGADATPTLGQTVTNDFGTIPAHSQLYAQWWLTSTLLGHFSSYDVQATHVTSYGNEDLSLLDKVTIHELIHSLEVNRDGNKLRGFMVNDIDDENDRPDMLYLTNSEVEPVSVAYSAQITKTSATELKLVVHPKEAGWNYGSVLDPTHGLSTIRRIVRQSDGKEIPLQNFWLTDRTLIDGKDWLYEYRLHFADEFASSAADTYIITMDPAPDVVLTVEQMTGMPVGDNIAVAPVETINVIFNKPIDPATFTTEDLAMNVQAERQNTSLITITNPSNDNKSFTLDLSTINAQCGNGYYTLTVQTADITDSEGFKGKTGKTEGWVFFQGGLVQLNTSVWPLASGSIKRTVVSGVKGFHALHRALGDNTAAYGSEVMLTATPEDGYEFANWTLNGDIVSTEPTYTALAIGDLNIVANFTPKNIKVNIETEGSGGSIQGAGTGIYEFGSKLTLTAVPDAGFILEGWTIDGVDVDGDEQLILTVRKSMDIEARFIRAYLLGDVNGDGDIDIADIMAMHAHILQGSPKPFNPQAADLNIDGVIDIQDVMRVHNVILKKQINAPMRNLYHKTIHVNYDKR